MMTLDPANLSTAPADSLCSGLCSRDAAKSSAIPGLEDSYGIITGERHDHD